MKYLKMLGLAAVAALALMALAGAGTASAAGGVLCHGINEPCEETWAAEKHMSYSLVGGTKAKLTNGMFGVVRECNKSSLTAKVLSAGTEANRATFEVKKEWLTFGECGETVQTVTSGSLEIEYRPENGTKGTVFAKNLVITAFIGGTHCYYKAGTGTDIGIYTPGEGGTDGIIAVNATTAKENTATHSSPIMCPANVIWDAEYTLTTITDLYIKKK